MEAKDGWISGLTGTTAGEIQLVVSVGLVLLFQFKQQQQNINLSQNLIN